LHIWPGYLIMDSWIYRAKPIEHVVHPIPWDELTYIGYERYKEILQMASGRAISQYQIELVNLQPR